MTNERAQHASVALSVIIPSYNSAPWLPSTLHALDVALARTSLKAEVIVVDDGSTDDTSAVLDKVRDEVRFPLAVLQQENRGRFLARWAGLQAATAPLVLLLDSRVLLTENALEHVQDTMNELPAARTWNGHVITDSSAPLVGLFWEVPTHVFWGGYLSNPTPTNLTLQNYDRLPKGTGVFIAPREVLTEACRVAWPQGDASLASDDTMLLRHIVAEHPVRIDPGFSAIYRPRTTVRGFVKHSFGRGTFFVDSFGGVSAAKNAAILAMAILPALIIGALLALIAVGAWTALLTLVIVALVVLALPAVVAAFRRCPARGVLAYFVYAAVFALPYWIGLLRGVVVHRRQLMTTHRSPSGVSA